MTGEKLIKQRIRLRALITMAFVLSTLTLFYSNCSAQHPTAGVSSLASTDPYMSCSIDGPQGLFQEPGSYSTFLQTNCATCHTSTGSASNYPFADSDPTVAYNAFNSLSTNTEEDYQVIDNYAINPQNDGIHTFVPTDGTPSPYLNQIDELQNLWTVGEGELGSCLKTGGSSTEFVNDAYATVRTWSVSKPIGYTHLAQVAQTIGDTGSNTTSMTQTLVWNLATDMLPSPAGVCSSTNTQPGCWPASALQNAFFEVDVTAFQSGNQSGYVINNPRIKGLASDYWVNSLDFKINGQLVRNETTFLFVNGVGHANRLDILSVGSMAALTDIRTSDLISFSIGEFQQPTAANPLPKPPEAPILGFTMSSDSVMKPAGYTSVTSGTGDLGVSDQYLISQPLTRTVTVQVSNYNVQSEPFTVPIDIDTTVSGADAIPPTAMIQVPNQAGKTDSIHSFMTDYNITNSGSADIAGPVQPLDSNNQPLNHIDLLLTIYPYTKSESFEIQVIPNDRYENNGNGTQVAMHIDTSANGNSLGSLPQGTTIDSGLYSNYTLNIGEPSTIASTQYDQQHGIVRLQDLLSPGGAFYQACIECHHPDPNTGLPLNQYSMTIFTSLMSNNHFIPNDANDSLGWERLTGLSTPTMPFNGTPLSKVVPNGSEYTNEIYNWINHGALNN